MPWRRAGKDGDSDTVVEGAQMKISGVQEFRSSGVQEFRSSGVQEFRSSGVQEFRSSGVQEFRSSGWGATPDCKQKRLAQKVALTNGVAMAAFSNSLNSFLIIP